MWIPIELIHLWKKVRNILFVAVVWWGGAKLLFSFLWDKFNWFEMYFTVAVQFNRKWYTNFICNNTFYIQFITLMYTHVSYVFFYDYEPKFRFRISLLNSLHIHLIYFLASFYPLCVKSVWPFQFKCNDILQIKFGK